VRSQIGGRLELGAQRAHWASEPLPPGGRSQPRGRAHRANLGAAGRHAHPLRSNVTSDDHRVNREGPDVEHRAEVRRLQAKIGELVSTPTEK
ncbi:MAG TPA: hypothetical protein VND98_06670, partial [Solirubrobacterales bacterium]|nr:hypothetical protein [Solirubrobacterales bacterium]